MGKPLPPLYAVPTTSGTGSETSVAAVISMGESHQKLSITDACLLPKYAVLDPELVTGLPPQVTAATGMDALTHAVESYINKLYNTEVENEMAEKAVKLIRENLLRCYRDGTDIKARENMQYAAFYAGMAMTRASNGYVHSVAHAAGGLYGTPHGLLVGIVLPHVLREYGAAASERLARLAEVCDMEGASDAEKAEKFICWIEELKREMDIPEKLDMVKDEDIPTLAQRADAEGNPGRPVPVIWDQEEFADFIKKIKK